MTEPWNTISLAASIAIFAAAGLARWRHWITSRTFALLWGASCAITSARSATRGWWPLAVAGAVVVALMLWLWWAERPTRSAADGGEQQ
ncbi:hypothetical protein [Streptomyces sp. NPDC004721]